jgi:hypothetical protein
MADYSLILLGKSLSNLTFQDIEHFFSNPKQESNNIEFKGFSSQHGNFNANIKGIIRAICGLLNSDGGIIIWGAPLGVDDPTTHIKSFVGQLAPVPDFKEKDVIINKVSDSITPLPVGISVVILQNSATENLYIFEIQPSPYKPHQFENIYLVRLDGQTKPAPHYFVEALFRKISYPNIECYLKFNAVGVIQSPSTYYISVTIFLFNFSKLQNEENIIYRLNVFPGKFESQLATTEPHTYSAMEPLLHFGAPMMSNQTIFIHPSALSQNNFRVNILLTIAGKSSPVKSSDYTLDLRNINLSVPTDVSNLISSKNENVLLADKQELLGTTKETTLLLALGRNP